MEIIVTKSIGESVGKVWKNLQQSYTESNSIFNVSAPLSSSALPVYEWIVENYYQLQNWDMVRFVLMDEQVKSSGNSFAYVGSQDDCSYEGYAIRNFTEPLKKKLTFGIPIIKPEITSLPFQGSGDLNPNFYYRNFAPNLPIDLLILAIGVQGNYANVMPGTKRKTSWHITKLSKEFCSYHTNSENSSYHGVEFNNLGMSLGPQEVLNANSIVVIISGEHKKGLAKKLFSFTEFNPDFPLSIIYDSKLYEKVKIYITEDLANILSGYS